MTPVRVSGAPRARGRALGEELRERIHGTWAFYRQVVFSSVPFDLEAEGEAYRSVIARFRTAYGDELEGIAEGSGLGAWQIAVLNARTELMHRSVYRPGHGLGECTAVYFPESRVLGQNWDWMDALEELMVLVEIEREDGHRILQLTEPGILGKIGFNSAGIGACLNILSGAASPPAVPVHVLLRAVLDASSLREVRSLVGDAGFGTCSHLLVADDRGDSASLELWGDECVEVDHGGRVPRHTNHYVGTPRDQSGDLLLPNSEARWARVDTLLEETADQTADRMKNVLLDREGDHSICGSWFQVGAFRLGTVCSIVMDLPARTMHITPGHPPEHPFEAVSLGPG